MLRRRRARYQYETRCKTPRCQRPASCRGVCSYCYHVAHTLVFVGSTTWAQLEATGKVAPLLPKQGLRPQRRPLRQIAWFLEAAQHESTQ